jgi:hypothetical protein
MTPVKAVRVGIATVMAAAPPRVVWAAALGSGLVLVVSAVATPIGLLVLLIVGPWDLVVWLAGVDWRTTHGQAPTFGAIVAVVGAIVAAGATLMFQASTERLEQLADGGEAVDVGLRDSGARAPLNGARQRP